MRIWIDFINTPQVSFFLPFIKDFKAENHELLLTCRDSGNTIELLRQNELSFHVVGNRVGKGILKKSIFFVRRLFELYFFVKKNKPDVAASQSSFYQPVVARFLNIPSLYTNDNEHAKGNLFGFLFATKVILPAALQNERVTKKWPLKTKVLFYPSVKESVYLSQQPELLSLTSGDKKKIFYRPEPWTAQYYHGPLFFFDETLIKLSKKFDVIILPRDKKQQEHYKQESFQEITVAQKPIRFKDILSDCILFIGAGGSMTRELAVIEVPVISVYHAKTLCVDRYLVDKNLLIINPQITYEEILSYLNSRKEYKKKWEVLNEGKKSFDLIKNLIINLTNE